MYVLKIIDTGFIIILLLSIKKYLSGKINGECIDALIQSFCRHLHPLAAEQTLRGHIGFLLAYL